MKFTKEEVKLFTTEVCSTCRNRVSCEDMGLSKEGCGKMFNWKIGFRSFVVDVLEKQKKEQGKI